MNEFDSNQLMNWLQSLNIDHYLCGNCEGIHITEIQTQESIRESRLFVQDNHVALVTELDIKNSALLSLSAAMAQLNYEFGMLKIFVDFMDDDTPKLIAAASMLPLPGVEEEAFGLFYEVSKAETFRLLSHLSSQGLLFTEDSNAPSSTESKSVH